MPVRSLHACICLTVLRLYRGDVDDRMLTEAMLPLLEGLAELQDVRPALHKRFGMPQ